MPNTGVHKDAEILNDVEYNIHKSLQRSLYYLFSLKRQITQKKL